jgi:tetratricopeptide (TPR) repeat protein
LPRPKCAEHTKILQEVGEKSYLSSLAAYLAENLCLQGKYDDAEHFTRVSQEAAASQDLLSQVLWRIARAKVLARRGEMIAALELAQEAVGLTGEANLSATFDAWLDFAEVLVLAGRPQKAIGPLERVLGLAEHREDVALASLVRARLEQLTATSRHEMTP